MIRLFSLDYCWLLLCIFGATIVQSATMISIRVNMIRLKALVVLVFIGACSTLNAADSSTKTALVIQNFAQAPLGILQHELVERGYAIETIDAENNGEQLAQLDPLDADLVIILGGLMGAYETDKYPFLIHEINLLRTRHDAAKPSLGICLGAQLMAKSLGANVYVGKNGNEFGLKALQLTKDGRHSPLAKLASVRPMQSHGDTFDLPAGVTWLASTDQYKNQAFSSNNSLAVQFHPEVTQEIINDWIKLFNRYSSELSPAEIIHLHNELQPQVYQFWQAWLDEIENN